MSKRLFVGACLLFLSLASQVVNAGLVVTAIGTLGGNYSYATGINDSGQVVGYSTLADGQTRAFATYQGQMFNLGTLGGSFSRANGINNAGQIVGISRLLGGQDRAFLYQNGTMFNLGFNSYSEANAINSSVQIAGHRDRFSAFGNYLGQRAFVRNIDGSLTYIGSSTSSANAINNLGQVAGWADFGGNRRAFATNTSGGFVDLGTLGGSSSEAIDINNDIGQIVGWSSLSNGQTRAFLYQFGNMIDLGTLGGDNYSRANGINDSGQIVGSSAIGFDSRGFLFQNGTMIDLNSLLTPGSGWTITEARGINNHGQIIGQGFNSQTGYNGAVLLSPSAVPEPGAMVMVASGLIGGLCFRRRPSCKG